MSDLKSRSSARIILPRNFRRLIARKSGIVVSPAIIRPQGSQFSPGFIHPNQAVVDAALVKTFKASTQQSNSATATWTFSAVAIGSASSDRWVFVCFQAKNNVLGTLNSATIGGVAATTETQLRSINSANNAAVNMMYANVPTGTTADIIFNWSVTFTANTGFGMGIDVYTVVGAFNGTSTAQYDVADTTSPRTFTYSIPRGGVAFATGACSSVATAVSGTITWDTNVVPYVNGLNRVAGSQANTDNVNALASQTATFTNFSSGGNPGPTMGRVYGHL
jgi:hypothetical protein